MTILKLSLLSFIIFIALDFVWIGFLARDFYFSHLEPVARIQNGKFQIVYWAGAMVYVLMALGLVLYILQPNMDSASHVQLWLQGALFGLIAYGIYDFTNLATLRDWNLKILAVDMAWGGFLCGTTALLSRLVYRLF